MSQTSDNSASDYLHGYSEAHRVFLAGRPDSFFALMQCAAVGWVAG